MNLGNKILLAQTPLGLILITVGFFFIFALNNLGLNTNDILTSNYRSIAALENMRVALDKLEWIAKKYDSGIVSKELYESKIASDQSDFERNLNIQLDNITITGEAEATENLQTNWQSIVKKLSNTKRNTLVVNRISNEIIGARDKMDLLIQINQDDSFFKSQNIISMINSFINLAFTFSAAGFLIGLLITIIITNRILKPLILLNKAVKSISNGEVGVKVDISGSDEITELASEFNSMIKSLEQYRSTSSGKVIRAKIFLQAALDTIPDPMLIISRSYSIESFNNKSADVFNLKIDQKHNLKDIIPEDIFEELSIKIRKNFVSDIKSKSLKPIFLKSKEDKYIEYFPVIRPIEQTGIGVDSVCLILRNITEVDLEGYLKAENVISSMHDLLTPLDSTQIGLHVAIAQKIGDLNNEQQRILGIAQKSCLNLRRIILNIIENNSGSSLLKEDKKSISNIDEILKNVLSDFDLIIENKKLNLQIDISHTFGTICGHKETLESIIKNILYSVFEVASEDSKINIKLYEKKEAIQISIISNSLKLSVSEISNLLDIDYKNRNKIQQSIFNANQSLKQNGGQLKFIKDEITSKTQMIIIFGKN